MNIIHKRKLGTVVTSCITRLFAYCKGGNFNIHIWGGSAISTAKERKSDIIYNLVKSYNSFLIYCRELATSTVSLTGDRAQGDDSKYDSHYNKLFEPRKRACIS